MVHRWGNTVGSMMKREVQVEMGLHGSPAVGMRVINLVINLEYRNSSQDS